MRTYWNVHLHRTNGTQFESMVHYVCVPIKGLISDNLNDTEFTIVARIITDEIISEIRSTYRTFGVDDISHCSLSNILSLIWEEDGGVNEAFKDRLQVKVNAMIQGSQSTQKSLSSVFESTLEKYNSPEDFADYMEEAEEEVDYEDYDTSDDMLDAITHAIHKVEQKHKQVEWCLLMVDVYTGTLTEVTVETNEDKTLDSILEKYLENGFDCLQKKRVKGILHSA
uniref:Protein kinase n=1 Tax=Bacillus phage Adastra TaxID=3143958 RepID=A0AAU8BB31_9CAUD